MTEPRQQIPSNDEFLVKQVVSVSVNNVEESKTQQICFKSNTSRYKKLF